MRTLIIAITACLTGAALSAGLSISYHDALRTQNASMAEMLTDTRIMLVETAVELSAIRDAGSCAGIPIESENSIGAVRVISGDGFIAMIEGH